MLFAGPNDGGRGRYPSVQIVYFLGLLWMRCPKPHHLELLTLSSTSIVDYGMFMQLPRRPGPFRSMLYCQCHMNYTIIFPIHNAPPLLPGRKLMDEAIAPAPRRQRQ